MTSQLLFSAFLHVHRQVQGAGGIPGVVSPNAVRVTRRPAICIVARAEESVVRVLSAPGEPQFGVTLALPASNDVTTGRGVQTVHAERLSLSENQVGS